MSWFDTYRFLAGSSSASWRSPVTLFRVSIVDHCHAGTRFPTLPLKARIEKRICSHDMGRTSGSNLGRYVRLRAGLQETIRWRPSERARRNAHAIPGQRTVSKQRPPRQSRPPGTGLNLCSRNAVLVSSACAATIASRALAVSTLMAERQRRESAVQETTP